MGLRKAKPWRKSDLSTSLIITGIKRFSIIGVAGYIAPAHLKAIKATGNLLTGAFDPSDSVGVLDSYFPGADFFTEFERFDRFIHKQKRLSTPVDFISICSPNYLHDSHVRFALRSGVDAICEKPVALNPWNVDALQAIEEETGKKTYVVLQLRHHPAVAALKKLVNEKGFNKKLEVELTYITARGKWYFNSWKGEEAKSGGIATNIGVHFFDMLYYVFGGVQQQELHFRSNTKASGILEYKNACVKWFLSIDENDLPLAVKQQQKTTYRSLTVDGEPLEFSEGFTELHTKLYQAVLDGQGVGLQESRPAIEIAASIRAQVPVSRPAYYHPFLIV